MAEEHRGFGESAAIFRRNEAVQPQRVHEVQASVAKAHFSQLLDEVERGATIVVLRHGKPVARIVPDEEQRRRKRVQALENMRKMGDEIRARNGGLTLEELLSSIHEGHKY
jgi:prevent-host-death family protein